MADLPIIKVALNLEDLDTPNLCSMAEGIKTTGDPDVTTPPYTDAQLQTLAGDTMTVHNKRATNQSKSLTLQENELCSKVRSAIFDVGREVQRVANKVAKAQGSVAAGEEVVVRCGFGLKKKSVKPPRGFEVYDSGPGWVHLRVKAVAKKAGYLWRFGRTTKKGIMPEGPLTTFFTLECEIIINNLESGDVMGFQMATILPVSKSNSPGTNLTNTTEDSSLVASAKAKKATISVGTDPYNWCDFIYDVCK